MSEENFQGGLTPADQTPPTPTPEGFKAVEVPQPPAAGPTTEQPALEEALLQDIPALDEIDLQPSALQEVEPVAAAAAEVPPEHQPWPGLPDIAPTKFVKQTFETYYPPASSAKDAVPSDLLILPADTSDRLEAWNDARPDEEITTEKDTDWASTLQSGETSRAVNDQFVKAVDREDGDWQQQLQHEQIPLMAARPRLNTPGDSMLTGPRAVQRIRALLGMGTIIQVPLWASGFWMSFRAPEEGDLLDLFQRLVAEKIDLGRRTYGLAFANSSSFIARNLLDFALRHLHETTLKSDLDPRQFIRVHDLQTIAWAMACTIWPKGFTYSRSVLGGEGEEKVIKKGRLDVSKLQFVDRARLTDRQLSHMSKRVGPSMTKESIVTYQNEFRVNNRRIQLAKDLYMTLHVPVADEYMQSGARWVDGIIEMVDRAFQEPLQDEARDRYVTTRGRATVMRQYGHWVKELIEIDGGREIVFSDPDTIDQLLNTLSSDDSIRKNYFEAIHTFTDDTTVSVIATPTVAKSEENLLPRYPRLVPIDAQYTFFTLLVQKNNRIQARTGL